MKLGGHVVQCPARSLKVVSLILNGIPERDMTLLEAYQELYDLQL